MLGSLLQGSLYRSVWLLEPLHWSLLYNRAHTYQGISNPYTAEKVKEIRIPAEESQVDRAHYCLQRHRAYQDSPQSIGHDATISAPHMHANAAESLLPYLKPGSRVLDIGSGSGYLTHVFANLVGKQGKVVGIEHIKPLADLATENMSKSEDGRTLLENGSVKFVVGDGRLGYQDGEGWDAIHVGAAAVKIHEQLIEQLRSPGRYGLPGCL